MMSATAPRWWDRNGAPATPLVDRVLFEPLVAGDLWKALCGLRSRMRRLSGNPRVVFVVAMDAWGRLVAPSDPAASQLALGYRIRP